MDPIYICRNKKSGKFFIHIEDTEDGLGLYITPEPKIKPLNQELFEDEIKLDIHSNKVSNLISKDQLAMFFLYTKHRKDDQMQYVKRSIEGLSPNGKRNLLEELLSEEELRVIGIKTKK